MSNRDEMSAKEFLDEAQKANGPFPQWPSNIIQRQLESPFHRPRIRPLRYGSFDEALLGWRMTWVRRCLVFLRLARPKRASALVQK